VKIARRVKDRQFKPEVQSVGMAEGIVALEWNEALRAKLSPETVAEVARLEEQIRSGALVVPRGF
jgi:hypothetical protein